MCAHINEAWESLTKKSVIKYYTIRTRCHKGTSVQTIGMQSTSQFKGNLCYPSRGHGSIPTVSHSKC